MKIAVLFLLLATVSGCALPVSVSHYGTARPVGAGRVRAGGSVNVPHDGGSGADATKLPGGRITQHFAPSDVQNNFDVYAAYGLTSTTDVSLKLWLNGAEAGVRQVLFDSPVFRAAIGGYGGGWSAQYGNSADKNVHGDGTVLDFPLTFSVHAGDVFSVFAGPTATRLDAHIHHFNTQTSGNVDYNSDVHLWLAGAFGGVAFGSRDAEISFGATVYQEPTTYPVENFHGDGFFVYPTISGTLTFGGPRSAEIPPN